MLVRPLPMSSMQGRNVAAQHEAHNLTKSVVVRWTDNPQGQILQASISPTNTSAGSRAPSSRVLHFVLAQAPWPAQTWLLGPHHAGLSRQARPSPVLAHLSPGKARTAQNRREVRWGKCCCTIMESRMMHPNSDQLEKRENIDTFCTATSVPGKGRAARTNLPACTAECGAH
jgi:hypothetical protein